MNGNDCIEQLERTDQELTKVQEDIILRGEKEE